MIDNILKTRRIFKSASTNQSEIKDLLQSIFVGELLSPSKCLWLISPWITDIEIIDNQSGSFTTIDPTWGRRSIHLTDVISKILSLGTHIVISTRSDSHNETFISTLTENATDIGVLSQLTINVKDVLHVKGILGDYSFLSGSMNITYGGIVLNEEQITFEIDKSAIGNAKMAFYDNYGGIL